MLQVTTEQEKKQQQAYLEFQEEKRRRAAASAKRTEKNKSFSSSEKEVRTPSLLPAHPAPSQPALHHTTPHHTTPHHTSPPYPSNPITGFSVAPHHPLHAAICCTVHSEDSFSNKSGDRCCLDRCNACGTEFFRVFRHTTLMLVTGRVDSPILELIDHPAFFRRETSDPWKPPGKGWVIVHSHEFVVIDSMVSDPGWATKLPALIDCRQTFYNESFFHVLRKWNTKWSYFSTAGIMQLDFGVL